MPEPLGDTRSIVDQVVAREMMANILDIACQQGEGAGIETRIDSLRATLGTSDSVVRLDTLTAWAGDRPGRKKASTQKSASPQALAMQNRVFIDVLPFLGMVFLSGHKIAHLPFVER